ncbi:decarbamoylnovobiocin carbamoyltransferase [Sinorhizobium sp. KGO-5]|jgi:carbamoyltransferase|uniref:carbamoyltransferase family protein n=1 Tax=Sinorhizobium sp. KGO-5 TaxID=1470810 RepID=UPI00294A6AD1|nr:decarbamoylnovobiocin carbamoyltransferase [Sinorhizobium sp. KGO-5]
MRILGISAFYHDSAAAIIEDGRIVAAAQEERFTRKKHDADFPTNAVAYCLSAAECEMAEVDHVVFYDKPILKFERLLETYLATSPRGFRSFKMAMPLWIKEKLFQKKLLRRYLGKLAGVKQWPGSLLFTEHHLAHAASAFFPSPFASAAVLTMDGVGEWCTTSLGHGRGKDLHILKEIRFPHSLGLLYSAFTYYTGFKVNSGEYKVMGLAPYGRPLFVQKILDHLIDLKEDGSFRLDQRYFDYCAGLTMTSPAFHELFGAAPRRPESPLTQREMDLAASVQAVTEEVVLKLARFARQETGERHLCLAGGVALNCVANGKLLKERIFDDIWIQPAAGDAGGAVGSALAAWHGYLGNRRSPDGRDRMAGAYLGPAFDQREIEKRLTASGAVYTVLSDEDVIARTVDAIVDEKAVGWMQGRMEFGPRALGGRSILGDPRSPTMQKTLNLKVKYRESFRPFAPSVRREDVAEWFDVDVDSPYMLLVGDVLDRHRLPLGAGEAALFGIARLNVPRSGIPAVTHVDYSARVQTVHRDTNPRYWELLSAFKQRTGCPVLVNTSFNVRGEPIVCTPEDAFRCFMGTEIECLVVGNCFLRKEDQPSNLRQDYKDRFELD